MNFHGFAAIVAASFQALAKQDDLFVVDVEDTLVPTYLGAFPEGTNPIYKTNTEHDCSCCKQFIRRIGHVVHVDPQGHILTVWDKAAETAEHPYNIVAAALRDSVRSAEIRDIFRTKEGAFGAEKTYQQPLDGSKVITWHHFYSGPIPREFRSDRAGEDMGFRRSTVQVFERGLIELSTEAIDTVLGLIDGNSLYRGAEHRDAVVEFRRAQQTYLAIEDDLQRNRFVWSRSRGPACRFRNTVIGTLVTDLSNGVSLEDAVRMFESKVAPANYKRTTALITPGMVKNAMAAIEKLGLEPALERRFARIEDISVNDVLWVDNAVQPLMKDGIAGLLDEHLASNSRPEAVDEKSAEDISIDAFVQTVLPEATAIEMMFKNEHLGNLMSLTAPVHPEPKKLFKWDNDFAWSYHGNVADSIKERVKRAGGNVTDAQLRASLSWYNYDDLDIHCIEPDGNRIYYVAPRGRTGGVLDVDMNAGSGTTREAVENISWVRVPDGTYEILVNNFRQRETDNVGFVVEIENRGKLMTFSYDKAVRNQQTLAVVTLFVKNGVIERFETGGGMALSGAISQEKWGIHTEQFVKVNAVTLSPNYWGENTVGNKHTFFVIDGCHNDEPTRGIYNEFLDNRLTKHRKVFEIIGDKTKCQPTEGQLSGLGFSSTKPATILAKVTQGKLRRLFNIHVGA